MACATISLKRSLEFDPLTHKRPKRRRCNPMALARLGNSHNATTVSPSSTAATTAAALIKPPSVFQEATSPLNKEQLAASIRTEIKRLRRCKTKPAPASSNSQSDSSDGELSSSVAPATSPTTQAQSSTELKKDNSPLFTFKQMTILCERVVKERTDQLREEYDQVLATKLAEQYESFLKFNHDQIQRHFTNSSDASYLS